MSYSLPIKPVVHAPRIPAMLAPILTLVPLCVAGWLTWEGTLAVGPGLWALLFLGVSFLSGLAMAGRFVPGFLCGLGMLLIGWRIAANLGDWTLAWSALPAFAAYVALFFDAAGRNVVPSGAPGMDLPGWALTFVRIYVGLDLVPHFVEKLFAGPGPRGEDVAAFVGMGLSAPVLFVVAAGLCELGAAIGVGLGIFTRLASVCAALYFLVATVIGGHFSNGFIWAGGGWEYSALMMALLLAFAVIGGGAFSMDGALDRSGRYPDALRRLAFRGRSGLTAAR